MSDGTKWSNHPWVIGIVPALIVGAVLWPKGQKSAALDGATGIAGWLIAVFMRPVWVPAGFLAIAFAALAWFLIRAAYRHGRGPLAHPDIIASERDVEARVQAELDRRELQTGAEEAAARRPYAALDNAERCALRVFVDMGKKRLTLTEFGEAAVWEGNARELWPAIERLAARKYLWFTDAAPSRQIVGLNDPHFRLLSEHPDWVGSDSMAKLVVG